MVGLQAGSVVQRPFIIFLRAFIDAFVNKATVRLQ